MPEIIVKLGDRVIHRYFFDKEMLSVGRARDNDIVIENLSVSRNHARIKLQDGKYILTDMNSANGTQVNGVRVSKTEVVHDDQIMIGKHTMHFLNASEGAVAPMPGPNGDLGAPPMTPSQALSAAATADMVGLIGVLTVTKGKQAGQEFRVYKPESTIGRASENEVRLHDWFVSKKHGAIIRDGDKYTLKDLDSWRGTTVNGSSIREVELREDDELVFGTTVLSFKKVDASVLPKAPPSRIPPDEDFEADSRPSRTSKSSAKVAKLLPQQEPPPDAPPPKTKPAANADLDVIKLDDDISAGPQTENRRTAEVALPSSAAIAKPAAKPVPMPEPVSDMDDEFAPMTEDELEALEAEAELPVEGHDEEEEHRRAMWEMAEAEKMYEMGKDGDRFSLIEEERQLRAGEDAAVSKAAVGEIALAEASGPNVQVETQEEEKALYGGAMTDKEPFGEPVRDKEKPAKEKNSSDKPDAIPETAEAPAPAAESAQREVIMWEKAMKNKSSVIRKNAAKELKKLTGKDYDWKSEPSGS
ncbi:hypothetical protein BH09SUM1_BH09SUM1_22900 [soil metagenome]